MSLFCVPSPTNQTDKTTIKPQHVCVCVWMYTIWMFATPPPPRRLLTRSSFWLRSAVEWTGVSLRRAFIVKGMNRGSGSGFRQKGVIKFSISVFIRRIAARFGWMWLLITSTSNNNKCDCFNVPPCIESFQTEDRYLHSIIILRISIFPNISWSCSRWIIHYKVHLIMNPSGGHLWWISVRQRGGRPNSHVSSARRLSRNTGRVPRLTGGDVDLWPSHSNAAGGGSRRRFSGGRTEETSRRPQEQERNTEDQQRRLGRNRPRHYDTRLHHHHTTWVIVSSGHFLFLH